ncbi:pyruvate, water dikinase regulatory protein [Pseudoalteromonas ardens]|uniref:Putative phosphoenolpyruvate synthase regulatory protein n=1 Tax=Pseudoalteromonas rubra TaxID=43658 RepID=A0A0L0EWH2_9GAMM|nr:pyruvate, water dikinase regulatory protein [Pseudoalteromonas sp. R96]KNC68770.1 phosphoenolpyruvate synthase regulatory protein [Pseudoalteromonas rubra]MDK1310050.1 pyruvate, water dikinase regulatory protein [Pseudoalteromonas sp. R96]
MRTAFYISDGTAITSEVFGHATLSMFPVDFNHKTIPFVETVDKAEKIKDLINETAVTSGEKPLVFFTFVNPVLSDIILASDGVCYDFLSYSSEIVKRELKVAPVPKVHRTHSIHEATYDFRIDAVNYALANDDGANVKDYEKADIILVGVSRSGKTPTSLYLALQYGIKAANYPMTEDDLEKGTLPKCLTAFKHKIFGLTIDPERLSAIRQERMANSRYASIRQCRIEVREVEMLFKKNRIPYLNSTKFSVEEISAKIMSETNLERRKY